MVRFACLAVFMSASAIAQPQPPTSAGESPATACSRWSLRGAQLGMPIGEFRKAQPKVKAESGLFMKVPPGTAAYTVALDRLHGLWLRVLTDRSNPDEPIVSVMLLLGESTDAESTVSALSDRWGAPSSPRQPAGKLTYFNAFGTVAETPQYITEWTDKSFGARARVEDGTRISPGPARIVFNLVSVYLEANSFAERLQSKMKQRAAEAVRP